MEPDSLLPHSQVPATCPYPEPARSSPNPHFRIPEGPFHYNPPIYAWVSQVAFFPQVSRPKRCTHLSFPHTRYTPPPFQFVYCIKKTILRTQLVGLLIINLGNKIQTLISSALLVSIIKSTQMFFFYIQPKYCREECCIFFQTTLL